MRKTALIAGALASMLTLAGIAAYAVPALAESEGNNAAACGPAVSAGPLDLTAIPVQQVSGKLSVKGLGCGDDDEGLDEAGRGEGGEHEGFDDD